MRLFPRKIAKPPVVASPVSISECVHNIYSLCLVASEKQDGSVVGGGSWEETDTNVEWDESIDREFEEDSTGMVPKGELRASGVEENAEEADYFFVI
ncbi:hypothetical protein HAX54_005215 [Datura stramonium]|uniref:Uncharacterized protein n=1 Tax=Datura stramonium TaxID=4076 RepID=A0ABS8TAQ5_DATST|nr:hypothetical protein [Datura stramonium]